ncbi:Fatty acid oxidation complex subunit alpha [Wickerhamomyces ciferrii]|uniref:Fatty acid oxidation complex subunit alpha n=1 Tax=Wickerhamomyces ciferrii (strain ATCC 14091 / BCRC 22168 / CBS 111 / JCM 3599 / NBRC 0793 / NRRL Y-1031 F-60-10) TaxID=1206466 RepID=K0KJW7_WICCF|nr:Fatty acid oxidation complex subunit alpha [Wickerhamomyces ciferrii]CCH41754.1 Fatty acid oxidation complex subunit alpha [Wickerhamomyces ciferrii]
MTEGKDILYEVKDKFAIITLNNPKGLNSLTSDQYLLLGVLMERANSEPNTIFTFIRSTGRYFSSGANVKSATFAGGLDGDEISKKNYWLSNFTARNAYLTTIFHDHTKVIISALNGPVVGLSSALVLLSDFIYAINDDVFLLTPFANLGLVSEGAAAATLLQRVGLSTANEALLLSRPIPAKRLYERGLINKIYNLKDTEKFNDLVLEEFWSSAKGLEFQSILEIKQLIKDNYLQDLQSTNSKEVIYGMQKWVQNIPQNRFKQVSQKKIKHKL